MKRSTVKIVARKSLLVLVLGTGALGLAGHAFAADAAGVQRNREQNQPQPVQQQQQQAPEPQQRREAAPPRGPQTQRYAPPQAQQQGGSPQLRQYRGGGNNNTRTYDRNGRPVVVGPPRGPQGPNARIVPPSRAYVNRPPRYVPSLPSGHRRYDWNGTPYYYGGGHWYRPYQNRYVVVGAPTGLFVSYLPGSYSTMWVGGTRYYYADDVYYTYEPTRRGYVVARSPYGDDEDYDEDDRGGSGDSRDQDIFIYPMRGQNEQQQADDRYECHRWAVKETRYDPTDSNYDRNDRSDYDRALTACLTGRGYSVK
jgi:hypothetical protein